MDETDIARVREMEARLNRLSAWLNTEDPPTEALREDVRRLTAYLRDGRWLADYEADEAGAFPADMPRGVLSQDALWDALAAYDERISED